MSPPSTSDDMDTAERMVAQSAESLPDFNLIPITLTEGPLKGQVVVQVKRKTPFRFLDLPAELRHRVYELLLVKEQPIGLATHPCASRVVPTRHPGLDRKYQDDPPTTVSLLRANKQIRDEATSILYGGNTFEPKDVRTLKDFLTSIHQSKRYLAALDFTWSMNFETAIEACMALIPLSNIERIAIHPFQVLKIWERKEVKDDWECSVLMARKLKQFLLHKQSTSKQPADLQKVMNVIALDCHRTTLISDADIERARRCTLMFQKIARAYLE